MVDLVVDVLSPVKKVTGIGESTRDKQSQINVSDVWHIWDILVIKYDFLETAKHLLDFAKDDDLKLTIKSIRKHIEKGAAKLEKIMIEYAIPLPPRTPQSSNSTINLEIVTDRYIFRRLFAAIRDFLPILMSAFINSASPRIIKVFKDHLSEQMDLYKNLSIYGEAKGYMEQLPVYMPS